MIVEFCLKNIHSVAVCIKNITIEIFTPTFRLYSHGKQGLCQSITQIADYLKMFNRWCECWILFEEYTFSGGLHKKTSWLEFLPPLCDFLSTVRRDFLNLYCNFSATSKCPNVTENVELCGMYGIKRKFINKTHYDWNFNPHCPTLFTR